MIDSIKNKKGLPLQGIEQKLFWGLILFTFALRVIFLQWNQGEYTDGILQLTLFSSASSNTFFMPFYTWISSLFNLLFRDMEMSGKLVSMVAGTLGLIPVYFMAKRLYGYRAAMLAGVLYSVSPEIWRWHLRVMTDSLFCTLFLWTLWQLQEAVGGGEEDGSEEFITHPALALGIAWMTGGLATLTRYQGLGLLPFLLWGTWQVFRKPIPALPEIKSMLGAMGVWLLAFAAWFGAPAWWMFRGMGHMGQYAERMGQSWGSTLAAYLTMGESFIAFYPYEMTYPVFLFALYGVFRTAWDKKTRNFYRGLGILFLFWLLGHAPFQSFQYRYFIPLLSLCVIPAGYGMVYFLEKGKKAFSSGRQMLVLGAILFSLIFAVTAIFLQRGTFGDIKDSALYMKENLQGKRILDNESYREGVNNIKVRYWSGLPVESYSLEKLQPGDYVCLHDIQININRELNRINQAFIMIPEGDFESWTLPLLADIMVAPPVTSRPDALLYRYFPQKFRTVLIRVEARPGAQPVRF